MVTLHRREIEGAVGCVCGGWEASTMQMFVHRYCLTALSSGIIICAIACEKQRSWCCVNVPFDPWSECLVRTFLLLFIIWRCQLLPCCLLMFFGTSTHSPLAIKDLSMVNCWVPSDCQTAIKKTRLKGTAKSAGIKSGTGMNVKWRTWDAMGNYSFKTTLIKKPLTMVPVSKDQPWKKRCRWGTERIPQVSQGIANKIS